MRVCDVCNDLNRPVVEMKLVIQKPDPENNRKSPEELHGKALELCGECVTHVWTQVVSALPVRKS